MQRTKISHSVLLPCHNSPPHGPCTQDSIHDDCNAHPLTCMHLRNGRPLTVHPSLCPTLKYTRSSKFPSALPTGPPASLVLNPPYTCFSLLSFPLLMGAKWASRPWGGLGCLVKSLFCHTPYLTPQVATLQGVELRVKVWSFSPDCRPSANE